MAEEPVTIVCNRVEDAVDAVDGATITQCQKCHKDVWIAPSSLTAIAKFMSEGADTSIWCVRCVGGFTKLELDFAAGKIELQPGQKEEIKAALEKKFKSS